MPQLDTTTFSSQLFWLFLCFIVLYFLLAYISIPKIKGVLDNREAFREQKINQASTYREQAENLLLEYEKLLSQARKGAHQQYQAFVNTTIQEIAMKKKDEVDKLQDRLHIAEQNLYRARIEASLDMQSVAQEIAGEILQKLTNKNYPIDQLVLQRDKK
jgi:F-type H+-transporting ATPase subunit b